MVKQLFEYSDYYKSPMIVFSKKIAGADILITDVNKTNSQVLEPQLRNWGAETTKTCDGLSAFSTLDSKPASYFKVETLNSRITGMDGLSLGKKIRQRPRYNSTHLILIISVAPKNDVQLFPSLVFSEYLFKPPTACYLDNTLNTVINSGDTTQPEVAPHDAEVWDKVSALKHVRGRDDRLAKLVSQFTSKMPAPMIESNNCYYSAH